MSPNYVLDHVRERVYLLEPVHVEYLDWEFIDAVHADMEREREKIGNETESAALQELYEDCLRRRSRPELRLRY